MASSIQVLPIGSSLADEHTFPNLLQVPPLPSGNHQSMRLALLSFCLELSEHETDYDLASVAVFYESVRSWCEKFGRQYPRKIQRQRGRMGEVWHLDEVYLKINGECKYLWRVDQLYQLESRGVVFFCSD